MKGKESQNLARLRKAIEELDLALYDAQDALAFLVWDRIKDRVVPTGRRRENNGKGLMLRGEAATAKMEQAVALARRELEQVMTSPHMVFTEIQSLGAVEYTNPGIFVSLYPMAMECLVDTMASEIVHPHELEQADDWNPAKRQFWVAPPWEWWRDGYTPCADEPEPATRCYLCQVEDGNATPYDPKKHHVCIMCAVRLWALATRGAGVMFQMRGTTVMVTHGQTYEAGEASGESPLLIYPNPN